MPAPHSADLRRRVVAAYRAGNGSFARIAEIFGVGDASVSRWVQMERRNVSLVPKKSGGRARKLSSDNMLVLARLVEANPDATLDQLAGHLATEIGAPRLSISAISRYCIRLGLTRKKSPSSRRNARRRG
jgi:transposase